MGTEGVLLRRRDVVSPVLWTMWLTLKVRTAGLLTLKSTLGTLM